MTNELLNHYLGFNVSSSTGTDEAADRALNAVTRKLDKTLSVEFTVNELIAEATDVVNLANMFEGECLFRPETSRKKELLCQKRKYPLTQSVTPYRLGSLLLTERSFKRCLLFVWRRQSRISHLNFTSILSHLNTCIGRHDEAVQAP